MNHSPWRYDPLSGLGNTLAFFERLTDSAGAPLSAPLSVLYFDLFHLPPDDSRNGHLRGEQALRWLALAIQDELPPDACFRFHEEEYAALLPGGTVEDATLLAHRVQDRFVRLSGWRDYAADADEVDPLRIVVLHLPAGSRYEEVDVIIALEAVMQQLRSSGESFGSAAYPVESEVDLRETVGALIERVLELGSMLDQAAILADTDPLTGLPNGRAMRRELQAAMEAANRRHRRFALLLVDGDNLRNFNKISYAAGDALIRQLGELLGDGLRHEDRIARWRMGDEFLILLPDADEAMALGVAERLVRAVAAREWQLPVTISVGVALYPEHGGTLDGLITAVESALARAKDEGKNRAVVAD